MIPTLRPYQDDAICRTQAAARNGARVIVLQSPTGSGKSTIGAGLVRNAVDKGKRVLFIVHRRRLVDQFSERLLEFEIDHGVCMRGHPLERGSPVQVASRDTLLSQGRESGYEMPPADLVIVDEGRHAAAPEFRRILYPYEQAGAYLVLLDATPTLADGSGLGPWAKAMVVAAKVEDLVNQGYLVPVKCVAPERKVKRGKVRRTGIAGDLVSSWQRYAEGQPTVLFVSRVQHSKEAVEEFQAAGIRAEHVDANTPDTVRDRIFDGLSNGLVQVVSNVGIIKEGVDIPTLGCCQIYMDVQGRVAFLQGCGRIMRPSAGKTHGILIDHAGAVFRHGFPDENTDWTLLGNVNEDFASKHRDGQTEKTLFCRKCELLYHGTLECPQCGRLPVKPPRSIFEAPPVEHSHELLLEADRNGDRSEFSQEEKVRHWLRCVGVAKSRNGNFSMAAAIYRQKYGMFPDHSFPCIPASNQWKTKIATLYPEFGRKKAQ